MLSTPHRETDAIGVCSWWKHSSLVLLNDSSPRVPGLYFGVFSLLSHPWICVLPWVNGRRGILVFFPPPFLWCALSRGSMGGGCCYSWTTAVLGGGCRPGLYFGGFFLPSFDVRCAMRQPMEGAYWSFFPSLPLMCALPWATGRWGEVVVIAEGQQSSAVGAAQGCILAVFVPPILWCALCHGSMDRGRILVFFPPRFLWCALSHGPRVNGGWLLLFLNDSSPRRWVPPRVVFWRFFSSRPLMCVVPWVNGWRGHAGLFPHPFLWCALSHGPRVNGGRLLLLLKDSSPRRWVPPRVVFWRFLFLPSFDMRCAMGQWMEGAYWSFFLLPSFDVRSPMGHGSMGGGCCYSWTTAVLGGGCRPGLYFGGFFPPILWCALSHGSMGGGGILLFFPPRFLWCALSHRPRVN